ncbi:hypothetical protein BGW42_006751 [Actinomortierella wolfii]|nr:hypothetical protein BGW42_006751 [Actinomortierella wolfii]
MQENEGPKVQNSASRLRLGPIIGRGGFGEVRYAVWDGQPCAVKIFFVSKSEAAQKDIRKEIMIMSQLRHQHIILFHRETIIHGRLAFIMEYAERHSLQKVIYSKTRLEWLVKEKITQGIVRGLAHIHSEGIIHRDLKSGNVLLTKHMEPKLCDFGLATVKGFSTTKVMDEKPKGTIRWMAPELFVVNPNYNTKTDIYALGWIMWELATNTTPPFRDQPADAVVISLVKEGERLPIPRYIPADYQQWIQRCWDKEPSKRPSTAEMVIEEPDPIDENENDQDVIDFGTISSWRAAAAHPEVGVQHEVIPSPTKSSTQPPDIPPLVNAEAHDTQLSHAIKTYQDVELQGIDDYREMAENDDKDALFDLGEMYMTGTGSVQDDFKALFLYFRAAEKGHTEAQFRIGQMYQSGRSIPSDIERAKHWFEKAIENGHVQAKLNLDAMMAQEQLDASVPEPQTGSSPHTSQSISPGHLPAPSTSSPIVFKAIIGRGRFGTVYFGRWGEIPVALKKLHNKLETQHVNDLLRKETDIHKQLNHRNILQFYGTAYVDDHLVIIMDYAEGGTLEHAIDRRVLDWPTKTRIAQEIIRGLAYIHSKRILHRNLMSANVLLTRHMEVRLADCGLDLGNYIDSDFSTPREARISHLRWMAPELFVAEPRYSPKSDIYALGMVMWEMAAECTVPFKEQFDNFIVVAFVRSGEREDIPDGTPAEYRQWIERCWHQDPSIRPEAAELITYDDHADNVSLSLSIASSLTDIELELSNDELTAVSPPAGEPSGDAMLTSSSTDRSHVESPRKSRIRRWLRKTFM